MNVKKYDLSMVIYVLCILLGPFVLFFSKGYVEEGATWIYVSILFGVPFIRLARGSSRIQKQGVSATATITGFVKTVDSDGNDSYYPCFEFDVRGKVYSVQNRVTYTNVKYQTGDKVNIHYLPDDPQQAEIDDKQASGVAWVFSCVFILAFIIGLLHFVFRANGFGEVYSKVWDLFF